MFAVKRTSRISSSLTCVARRDKIIAAVIMGHLLGSEQLSEQFGAGSAGSFPPQLHCGGKEPRGWIIQDGGLGLEQAFVAHHVAHIARLEDP